MSALVHHDDALLENYTGIEHVPESVLGISGNKYDICQLTGFQCAKVVRHIDVGGRVLPHDRIDVPHRKHDIVGFELMPQASPGIIAGVGTVAERDTFVPDRAGIDDGETDLAAFGAALSVTVGAGDGFRPFVAVPEACGIVIGEDAEHRRAETNGGQD